MLLSTVAALPFGALVEMGCGPCDTRLRAASVSGVTRWRKWRPAWSPGAQSILMNVSAEYT